MPEELRNHEQVHTPEQHGNLAEHEARKNLERIHDAGEQAEHDPLQQSVERLRERAEHQAVSGQEYGLSSAEDAKAHDAQPTAGLHRQLKNDAYDRSLRKARAHLSAPERAMSRIIHQSTIEAASSAAANTIGRPWGLLAGSIFALLGSGALLYMSRRYGFEYNYGVFLLCFVAGFALGLFIELIVRIIRRKHIQ